MKRITKIAIGAAAVMLIAASLQPALARCATPRLVDTLGAYMVSNPSWGAAASGGDGSCTLGYGYGCYASQSGPPVSSNLDGVFWAMGAGDPIYQLGVDNGSWAIANWSKHRSGIFDNGTYYYPAFLTLDDGTSGGVSGNPFNWSFPVDGCPDTLATKCTCVLVTDQWNGQGYFMVASGAADGNLNYDITPSGGIFRLAAIPTPAVTMSERDAAGNVTFTVDVPGIPAAADYRDPSCECNLGFLVYAQVVGRGGMAPAGRRACTPQDVQLPASDPGFDAACQTAGLDWQPAKSPTGGAQTPTPLSAGRASTSVTVSCDPALQQDLYLSTALVDTNSGLVGPNVSTNSFRVECGANLAEPGRRDPGKSGDAPRGRDQNRGRNNQ